MKKYLIIVFVVVIGSFQGISQNLLDDNSTLIEQYFNTALFTTVETSNITPELPIQTASDVQVTQVGNYNYSYIISGKNNKQNINQIGDSNNYEYYSYYNSNPAEVNTLQLGTNNNIQIFGQNELTKNLNIIQNTNDKMIIIKNY